MKESFWGKIQKYKRHGSQTVSCLPGSGQLTLRLIVHTLSNLHLSLGNICLRVNSYIRNKKTNGKLLTDNG